MVKLNREIQGDSTVLIDEVLYLMGTSYMVLSAVSIWTHCFLYSMENYISLCEQMLHGIFFLGNLWENIWEKSLSPGDIIDDKILLKTLKKDYPRPFQCYKTHLPKRSPFSCVLDMVRKYYCYFHSVMIHFHSKFICKILSLLFSTKQKVNTNFLRARPLIQTLVKS